MFTVRKSRHAAVLALGSWYLMVPPVKQSWSWTDDAHYWIERLSGILPERTPFTVADKCTPDVHLSEWEQSEEFERLSEYQAKHESAPEDIKRQ
jgi:hypothetical protein